MPAVSLGLMPDLRGLSARAAMKSLTSAGLTVKLSGDGVVAEQFPEAGAPLIPGDVAKLKLVRHAPETLGGGFQQ
jgi:hypothetical protein